MSELTRFVITIPVRNANLKAGTIQLGHLNPAYDLPQSYIERCLLSTQQEYPRTHYRIMIGDDGSTDGTWEIAKRFALCADVRVSARKNVTRLYQAGNLWSMAREVADDEVIVCLDGDDQLAHNNVLGVLNGYYQDAETWLTYGSWAYDAESRSVLPGADARGTAAPMPEHSRRAPFFCTHLRTYRRWLFDRINILDLHRDGKFFPLVGDLLTMYPMIEMAGPEHSRYLHEILYLYNTVNPFNDLKGPGAWPTDTEQQRAVREEGIRAYGHEHILVREEIEETVKYVVGLRQYPRLTRAKEHPRWPNDS